MFDGKKSASRFLVQVAIFRIVLKMSITDGNQKIFLIGISIRIWPKIQSISHDVPVLSVVFCCAIPLQFVQLSSSVESVGCSTWGRSTASRVFRGGAGPR